MYAAPSSLNLILTRSTTLSLYTCSPTGLTSLLSVPLNGRASTLTTYRRPNRETDTLVLTTDRGKVCSLEWEEGNIGEDAGRFKTVTTGDFEEAVGAASEVRRERERRGERGSRRNMEGIVS